MSIYKFCLTNEDSQEKYVDEYDNYTPQFFSPYNFNSNEYQCLPSQEQNQQFHQKVLQTDDSNIQFSTSSFQYSKHQLDPDQQNVETETKRAIVKRKPNQRVSKKVSKNEPIVKNGGNKIVKQKTETKNLPKFFINSFLNRLEMKFQENPLQNIKIKQKINKFENKPSSLKTLQEMLKDPIINDIAQKYICSFDFLHQIFKSERLQDVLPPIKYINKLYQGCFNSKHLNQWKEY